MTLAERALALIRVPSVIGDEKAIADLVEAWAQTHYAREDIVRVSHSLVIGRRVDPRPTVALVGHLDTVPSHPDGNVPRIEAANWLVSGLNNFRQNRQPGSDYAAPDATVALRCETSTTAIVTVRNVGEAFLPPGVVVDVVDGSGATRGTVTTTRTLLPAESETFEGVPSGTWDGTSSVRAAIRPGSVPRDCNLDNDSAELLCLI